jgi:hypothetical protein
MTDLHSDEVQSVDDRHADLDGISFDEMVAHYRAKLAGWKSPLDRISPEEWERIHREFRDVPEVSGIPYPTDGSPDPYEDLA